MNKKEFILNKFHVDVALDVNMDHVEETLYDYWCDVFGLDVDDEFANLINNLQVEVKLKEKSV